LQGQEKVNTLNLLAEKLVNSDPAKTKKYADEALKIAKSINYQYGIADAIHKQGIAFYYQDDYENTLDCYTKSLVIAKQINNKKLIAQALSWTGALYRIQNDFAKANQFLNEAIFYANQIDDNERIVYCLRNLGEVNRVQQKGDSAILLFNKALKLAEKINDQNQQAYILTAIGEVYRQQSDLPLALKYLNESIDKSIKINNKNLASNNYYSVGEIYLYNSEHSKALEYLQKSLLLAKDLKDNIRMADCYASMGDVFRTEVDHENAETYYKKSLSISTQINYKYTKSYCYFALGMLKKTENQYDLAMEYFNRSISIANEINDNWRVSDCYNMIGDLHTLRLNYSKAEEFLFRSLDLSKEIGNRATEGNVLTSLSDLYFKKKDFKLAKKYAEESLAIANEVNVIANKRSVCESLYKIYERSGDFKNAFHYHVLFKNLSDSSRNEETTKKLVQQQLQFEFTEQEKVHELEQAKKDAIKEAELHKQQMYTIFSFIGLLLVLVLAIVIFRSQRKQKLVNIQLGRQKQQIETQKKEITDSINYSKRIQTALLPDDEQIRKHLPNSFVYYKPKDIVSGDFYYFASVKKKNTENETQLIIAAADCTGHGVPGALMSVVSYQKLDTSARIYNEPNAILKRLNKGIKKALKQTLAQNATRDGLDIALAVIDQKKEHEYVVQFSMANRPVYVFKNKEFIELKPTKAAIGGYTSTNQEFDMHELNLQSGDTFYLFSDGYADQFGGEKGKKLMTARFKEILKNLQSIPISGHRDRLEQEMQTWMGTNEQVDDFLVIGVQL
jgi:tetratricopeptide (TPR) repeat protein